MEVVTISMDGTEGAAQIASHVGAEFPVLSDQDGSVARQYGVYNLLGDGLAAPAIFILGKDGAVWWRHVGTNISDRPSAETILRQLQEFE